MLLCVLEDSPWHGYIENTGYMQSDLHYAVQPDSVHLSFYLYSSNATVFTWTRLPGRSQLNPHTFRAIVHVCLFVWFDSLYPINNISVLYGRVFLGWTSTKLGLKGLAQGHNAVMPTRLEPAAPRPRFKHSATEPLRSLVVHVCTNVSACT